MSPRVGPGYYGILVVETPLWPLLHIDGRSNGPDSVNRQVTSRPLTEKKILFFNLLNSQEKGSLKKTVANGLIE